MSTPIVFSLFVLDMEALGGSLDVFQIFARNPGNHLYDKSHRELSPQPSEGYENPLDFSERGRLFEIDIPGYPGYRETLEPDDQRLGQNLFPIIDSF